MKGIKKISVLFAAAFALLAPAATVKTATAFASPASSKIVTDPTGYTEADDVSYVKTSGGIVSNWGARGEDCVFLSEYAEAFYTGDYQYGALSQKSGSHKQTQVPSSDLYSSLAKLMTDAHVSYTYYKNPATARNYYEYTDCVANDTSHVSLLYRGTLETSTWNSGEIWNQEHMWPQSMLEKEGAAKEVVGDIMHLRSSNTGENSSRGNKPYGNASPYYNPGPSVRGDCARTFLYMYVRWGLTKYPWGTGGVMESIDVLLDWMEEDPVDTWEMGRNDAVQSITGTRNVFIDYPEYAWLLFDREIPTDIVTPSGIAADGAENETPDNSASADIDGDGSSSNETQDSDGSSDTSEESASDGCAHEYGRWYVIQPATTSEQGEQERFCKKCGESQKEIIEILDGEEGGASLGCTSVVGGGFAGFGALAIGFFLYKKRKH